MSIISRSINGCASRCTVARMLMIGVVGLCLLAAVSGCNEPHESGHQHHGQHDHHGQHAWMPLFNGEDLAGWQAEGEASWSVQDGMLVGTQGENNAPGDLFTEGTFDDFVLIVTYRIEWPANSGVWFRYQAPDVAYQADILEYKNPECYSGTLYCPGKMFLAMNEDKDLVNREGWNTLKIRCEGNHTQIWLNDKQVADVLDDTTEAGRIGFQIHEGDQFATMKLVVREAKIQPL